MYLHTKVIFFEPSIGRLISPYNLAFLRANLAMGRKRGKFFIKKKKQIFQQIYTGQMIVRDSRKFDEKFGKNKVGQQIWEICLLRDLPADFSPKKYLTTHSNIRHKDRILRVDTQINTFWYQNDLQDNNKVRVVASYSWNNGSYSILVHSVTRHIYVCNACGQLCTHF